MCYAKSEVKLATLKGDLHNDSALLLLHADI